MMVKSTMLVACAAFAALSMQTAHAAPVLSIELIQAGYAPIIVTSASGVAVYNGSYGVFDANVTTGAGQPILPASQGIDLNSINISTNGSGSLTLLVTEVGLTSLNLDQTYMGAIGGTLSGSVSSIEYSAFIDLSNVAFGTAQQIGVTKVLTDHAFSATTTGEITGLTGPFSLTEQVVINAGPGTSLISFDGQLSPVPLPASAPMFGAALVALGGFGYSVNRRMVSKAKTDEAAA